MDKLLRFSEYEIFAYAASGLAAMLVWDFVFGTHWVLGAQWGVYEGVAVLFGAYVIGHVVAWPASWLLERRFVRRFLGAPATALFREAPPGALANLKRRLFPDYFTPLDQSTQDRVKARALDEGHLVNSGEGLFWLAFAQAKRDAPTYARMEAFLKHYGFCRNMSFVALAGAMLLTGDALSHLWHEAATGEAYTASGGH